MESKYHFFWGGPFSNWYPSLFTDGEITYNCVEQYMMYKKALVFNDQETADKILAESDPRTIKKLGRKVKDFTNEEWDKHKYNIVKEGCKFKFEQDSELQKYMFAHRHFELVEASPYDAIWGIGFRESDALENIDAWGENLLGKVLNGVAEELY